METSGFENIIAVLDFICQSVRSLTIDVAQTYPLVVFLVFVALSYKCVSLWLGCIDSEATIQALHDSNSAKEESTNSIIDSMQKSELELMDENQKLRAELQDRELEKLEWLDSSNALDEQDYKILCGVRKLITENSEVNAGLKISFSEEYKNIEHMVRSIVQQEDNQ